MTDDMKRARELRKQAAKILADAYKEAHFFGAADDALSDTPSPHCKVAITAIAAALRAAPEGFVLVPVEMDLEMEVAFCEAWFSERRCIDDVDMQDAWAAALAARPQVQP